MTTSASEHYENHLGPIYSWMLGDIDAALARSDLELESLGLPSSGAAVDLGAGFDLHALPLARRGFSVVALDTYQPLLNELLSRAGSLPIRTVNANLLAFREHTEGLMDAILCMGDTLTHLPDTSSVESLFTDWSLVSRMAGSSRRRFAIMSRPLCRVTGASSWYAATRSGY